MQVPLGHRCGWEVWHFLAPTSQLISLSPPAPASLLLWGGVPPYLQCSVHSLPGMPLSKTAYGHACTPSLTLPPSPLRSAAPSNHPPTTHSSLHPLLLLLQGVAASGPSFKMARGGLGLGPQQV